MEKKTINVFWTGGWDSTFRILQLSDKPVIIQPYYLKDNRKSEQQELDAIKNLTEKILALKATQCTINPLITLKVSEIEKDLEITAAYKQLFNEYKQVTNGEKLGTQYEWLARFSKNIDTLELGIEKDSRPSVVIEKFGEFEKKEDPFRGKYSIINKNKSSEVINKIFGNYHYPLLNFSKLQMKKIAEDLGYITIMNQTWFCHRPIHKKACGKCNPCMQTIEFGLKYRFSKIALIRYQFKKAKLKVKSFF